MYQESVGRLYSVIARAHSAAFRVRCSSIWLGKKNNCVSSQWNFTYSLNKELWKCLCKVHTIWVILLLRRTRESMLRRAQRSGLCSQPFILRGGAPLLEHIHLAWTRMVLTQDIFIDAQGFLFYLLFRLNVYFDRSCKSILWNFRRLHVTWL